MPAPKSLVEPANGWDGWTAPSGKAWIYKSTKENELKPAIRNTLAVIAGFVIGSAVNMGFIVMGPHIIPPPLGADTTTMEGLKESMPLFEPKHFIFPFLAHALGTLAGAAAAAAIGASHKAKLAMGVGVLFLCGGIANVLMLPSPMWYNVLDVVGAYLPMAWIGWKLVSRTAK